MDERNDSVGENTKKEVYAGKVIEFDCKIQPMDMFDFYMKHNFSHWSGAVGIFISICALVYFLITREDNTGYMNGLLLFTAVLFTVIHPIQLLFRAWKQVKLNPLFQKPIHYWFQTNEISVGQEDEKIEIPWEVMYKLLESRRSIILYTSKVNAYILPKDQMQGQYEEVREMIHGKMDAKACKWKGRKPNMGKAQV